MQILLDDGLIVLEVLKVLAGDIICKVVAGGEVGSHKGVNVPGAKLRMPAVSEKDRQDIVFAVEHDLDFISASFTACSGLIFP